MGNLALRLVTATIIATSVMVAGKAVARAECRDRDPDISIPYCTAIIQVTTAPVMLSGAYTNRGLAFQKKGLHSRAVADYDQAIKANPGNFLAFNNRCYVRGQLGELDLALSDCETSVKLSPHNPIVLDSRGFIFLLMGKYERAVEDYNEALRLSPQSPASLYGRGVAKWKLGDPMSAAADISAAKHIDPDVSLDMMVSGILVDAATRLLGKDPTAPSAKTTTVINLDRTHPGGPKP